MKNMLFLASLAVLFAVPAFAQDGAHRIGGGVNYWVSVDDVEVDDVDEDGFSYLATYQYKPGVLGLGADVELLPDRFGEDTYAGQAYLILGEGIYAGAGIGIVYADSEFADDPFFSFRAGLNLELLPGLLVDVYGQYRFESEEDLDDSATDIDTDTIYLGAALRLKL